MCTKENFRYGCLNQDVVWVKTEHRRLCREIKCAKNELSAALKFITLKKC